MSHGSKITRRTALQAAVACGVAPAFLRAADKAGAKNAVVGKGEHQYECLHHFLQPPQGFEWQTTHNIAVDSQNNIYVKERGHTGAPRDTIYVFDATGKFVRSFGKEYFGGGHGIDIRKEGGEEFLYLTAPELGWTVKTHINGEHVWETRAPEESGVYKDKAAYKPTNVAFHPDGGFYVADGYGSNYIHQYDKNGKWLRHFGGTGKEPGQFATPHGLWLDDRPGREPSLVVADRANNRLQWLTLEGKPLSMHVDAESFPAHFDTRGELLLLPDLFARVTLFDKDNNVIDHLGFDPAWTKQALEGFKLRGQPDRWQPGRFIHPHDACFDHEGNILVVEWVHTGRITKLRKLSG